MSADVIGEMPAGASAAAATEAALDAANGRPELGAVWFLAEEAARDDAARVDRRRAEGWPAGRLAGVPVLVKDAFAVSGMPGGAGGPVVTHTEDAPVVAACRRAGAIVIGKAAMHQLGWGMSGQCPGRPTCANPVAPGRQPGGSSSGSAAAVAAGIVRIALGADTGGSVRLPAAWCRVVGFKPMRGALSVRGVAPVARSFDAVGYLGRSVDDCRLAHEMLGLRGGALQLPEVSGARVAIDPAMQEDLEPEVADAFERGLDALRSAGVVLVDEALPDHRVPVGRMYARELAQEWAQAVDSEPEAYGEDVRLGIESARASADRPLDDAYQALHRIRERARIGADAFVSPTCPTGPPAVPTPVDVGRAGRLLRPFNVLDWPAISVPCPGPAVPAGVQLAAPRGRDALLLALARTIEAAGE